MEIELMPQQGCDLEARLRPAFLAALAGDRAGHSVADAAKAAGMSETAAKVASSRAAQPRPLDAPG